MDRCETSHLNCEGLRRACDRATFSGYEGAAANSARSRSVITQANAPELNASTVSDNPSGAISALSHCQNAVIAALPTKNIRVGQGRNVPEQRHLCGEAQQAGGEARAADLRVVERSAVLVFQNQPLPIAYLMAAPYSAGAAGVLAEQAY